MLKTGSSLVVTGISVLMGVSTASAGVFAGQDFDGNAGVAGPTSEVFSPDNSGNTSFGGAPGVFPSSNFDVFGITNRAVGFEFADDTLNGFAADLIGFAGVGAEDPGNFVGFMDTINADNAMPVTATWTFDVSGKTDLVVGMDFTAYGDFEDSDIIIVQASIDGGANSTIFHVGMSPAQDAMDTPYQLTMDDGDLEDVFFNPFYSQADWDTLTTTGPTAAVGFHPLDDGVTNGDTTANDGWIPEPIFSNAANETRAYMDLTGGFYNQQVEAMMDPLYEQVSGTQLDNALKSFTAALAGTGSTLTLSMTATLNGGINEAAAIDNITISGVPEPSTLALLGLGVITILRRN